MVELEEIKINEKDRIHIKKLTQKFRGSSESDSTQTPLIDSDSTPVNLESYEDIGNSAKNPTQNVLKTQKESPKNPTNAPTKSGESADQILIGEAESAESFETNSEMEPENREEWKKSEGNSGIDENSDEKQIQLEIEKSKKDAHESLKKGSKKRTKGGIGKEEFVLPADLTAEKDKIDRLLRILSDFKNKKPSSTRLPRKEYISKLAESFVAFFGYSRELIDALLKIFSPHECRQFLEANEAPRPVCIRSNPLLIKRRELAQRLINKGVNLDPIGEWTRLGLKITESQIPLGATIEYLSGLYTLQSAASMIPAIALGPKEGDHIADLCAAPGGKTTHIASLMKNHGLVVANDMNGKRTKALHANLHRMGVTNTLVINYDARDIGKHFGKFDRILLDAPCSGMGVISRDETIKTKRTLQDINKSSHIQKELLLAAVDMLRVGGTLVYSTCSIMVEENEAVINYGFLKRHLKIEEVPVGFGIQGFSRFGRYRFHPHIKRCRRYYPHVHNMDGFFVAKLSKIADGAKMPKASQGQVQKSENSEECNSRSATGEKRRKIAKTSEQTAQKGMNNGGRDELRAKENLDAVSKKNSQKILAEDLGGKSTKLAKKFKKKTKKLEKRQKSRESKRQGKDKSEKRVIRDMKKDFDDDLEAVTKSQNKRRKSGH